MGITFNNGVVLAAERRFSYGTFVVSRHAKKVFKITDQVGAACAGMAADMQILVRQITAYVKIRELEINRPMPPNSVAKLLGVLLFENRFAPFLAQVIVGGLDGKPSIFVLDPIGSVIPDEYASVGTGAEMAIGVIDAEYTPGLKEEDAKKLAVKAIRAAIQRDSASGDGVEMLVLTPSNANTETLSF